jgi:transcriptional repressor NrdR
MPVVVKTNNVREPYDESKVRAGMEKALEKRPVSREALDEALSRVTHKVRIHGDREIPSRVLGEFVMDELQQLDEVAFVRFASVYRHFQTIEAFQEEIQRLRDERPHPGAAEGKRAQKPARDANRDQLPLLPADTPGTGSKQ